ncbi:MAG: ABC transporter ATP-binding protein [Epsilonproteobacteria bacterium]|nr:ABC transporter ATP-binding protein [Campylobacterota bacterium]OIO17799.1 MAG: ABC transporter ATP-binding protein [Helicobacteraceae bacterium CG1_02_36_14]PIP10497.1 MAG: ABC transporter ATP-binding protein [Sulfurimonas sp. CG23_combo_of_CG06-09_8_20_14_all_36_33]PIS26947.1 MAG: ABC transporter ATP-binding protein [Sulfurimonas sp. CG08_land_8_20_14_0_20_36_33]PIU35841.1 MAG: ABC transporter ATP-binding protein [Sulfurimonas sp. CG07_land_8_20_14_0_80_36_56]PIV03418.1 MAG: ABC transport
MKLLSAKHISHTFEYELFNDVSLELDEKETIAIIGMSGSGKSTLLHILSTLLKSDSGKVSLFGEESEMLSKKRLSQIKRDDLGLVFQSHYLFKGFSAYENLEVASILSNKKIDETLLQRLKIDACINQKVTELSGGQQQRVSIARVLTKQPRIIFADEPTGNLDKQTASEVMELLFEYCENKNAGMLLVTHDETLAYLCKKVYRLENKKLEQVK